MSDYYIAIFKNCDSWNEGVFINLIYLFEWRLKLIGTPLAFLKFCFIVSIKLLKIFSQNTCMLYFVYSCGW